MSNNKIQTSALYKAVPILAPVYGLALSLVYLQAYWGSFKINVFAYASPANVALLAAYGVLPLVTGILAGALSASFAQAEAPPSLQSERAQRNIDAVKLAIFCGVTMVPGVYAAPYLLPLWLSVLGFIVLLRPLIKRVKGLTDSGVVAFTVIVPVGVAFAVVGTAFSNADRILYGFERDLANVRLAAKSDVLDAAAGSAVHHLGHVGDYDFFYVPRSETVVRIASDQIQEIAYARRDLCFRCFSPAGGEADELNSPWGH